jgi:hypothetical protein
LEVLNNNSERGDDDANAANADGGGHVQMHLMHESSVYSLIVCVVSVKLCYEE